ncbi:hypothetical protein ABIB06_004609 [Bradyrhizobium sp. LB8.2]|uniref:hypothetical protein n=1 Tax=unclassified Bradyrhizobium TaxID=2631580 RepID=UPI00339842AC
MRTILIVLGAWILINALIVLIMIPPRKPRKSGPRQTGALAPVPIDQNGYPFEKQEKPLRHVIVSIAMGAFFSLAPPLIEAVDSVKRFIRKRRG